MIIITERKIIAIKAIMVCMETPSVSRSRLQPFRYQNPLPGSVRAHAIAHFPLDLFKFTIHMRENTPSRWKLKSLRNLALWNESSSHYKEALFPMLHFSIYTILLLFPTFFFSFCKKNKSINNTTGEVPPCARDLRKGSSSRCVHTSEMFVGDFPSPRTLGVA